MPGDGGLDRGDGSWRLSPGRGPARSAQLCPDTQIAMLSFISQCLMVVILFAAHRLPISWDTT